MWIGLQWKNLLEGGGPLGQAVVKELEALIGGISAWSSVEHNDDGTHADVTADSVIITPIQAVTYALRVTAGLASLDGSVAFPGAITPDEIVANTNDYGPPGWSSSFFYRLSTDTSRNLTGIVAPDPAVGRLVLLANIGSNDLVLKHESGSSVAANRFVLASSTDVTLSANSTFLIYYDLVQSRWIGLGGTGGGGGLTPHNLLSVTHPDTTPAAPVQGDTIIATRTNSGAVDGSKYWADGIEFGGISTSLDAGSETYWGDGFASVEFPTSLVLGTVTWQRLGVGSANQVLTTSLVSGQLVPQWANSTGGGSTSGTGARAYITSDITLVSNVVTPVTLAATEFDTAGYWSVTAPTGFTTPSTGLYIVIAQATWRYSQFGPAYVQIYVNGAIKANGQYGLNNIDVVYDNDPHQVSAILSLTVGDFVSYRVRATRYSGAAPIVVGGQNATWFSIAKVG